MIGRVYKMFEYYKWKLANKQIGKPVIKPDKKEPVAKRVWIMVLIFASAFTMSETLATFFGTPLIIISLIVAGISFTLMILGLLKVNIKNVAPILLKSLIFLIGTGILWALIFAAINGLIRLIFGTRGQITNALEIIIWLILMVLTPVVIVLFFRFMDGRKLSQKIHRKIYLELLITILVGTVLTYFPNAIVMRTLFLTRLVHFILLTIINTGLVAGIITTCRNRGVL